MSRSSYHCRNLTLCNAQIWVSHYYLYNICQGNIEAAFNIYKEALEMAEAEEKMHALPILYVHYSRLKYTVGLIFPLLSCKHFEPSVTINNLIE